MVLANPTCMPSSMHQGKRQALSWAIGLPPSKNKVTARRSVDMAQSKKSTKDLC